ncbi:MAG TPA: RNA polymerase sigma factor RpoD, partial [Pseudoduganella sp.]
MTKTPKTLTLSAKKPAAAANLAVPKPTLSYVIDNAQEEAGKVTVVKKTRRLAAVPVEAPVEAAPEVKAKAVRKTGAAKPAPLAAAVEEAPPPKVTRARKPKADAAPVTVSSGPAAVTEVKDAAV